MSQLKKGAILSYINILLTNVIGLILTPFIIKSLGDSEYGLYALIGSFIAYFSLMDLGLNNTIIRFVAKYRAEKDSKGEANFLAVILLIYSVISLVIVVIGIITYFNLDKIYGSALTAAELYKAKIMFVILIFNVGITIVLVVVLLYGGDAISIVILDTVINVLFITVNWLFVNKKLKVKFKLYDLNKELLAEVFSYSIWIFMIAIIAQFQWQSGQLVLGALKDTTTVAIYAVGVMLGTYYGAFASAFSSLLLPKATKMLYSNASKDEIDNMFIKIGRITLIILFFILGGFILYGKQFVTLWLGENYILSWKIALFIMLVITIPLTQSFANSILEALNKIKFKAILSLSAITMGMILGVFLVEQHGSLGMIFGILFGRFLSELLLNIYYIKILQLDILQFLKKVFIRISIVFSVILVLGLLIDEIPGEGWLNFISKIFIYGIIFSLISYNFIINKEEKLIIKKNIKIKQ